ncbi:hypothetical protein GE061_009745 [Apolygus lucorum]|uniref:Uncharacterized protein n=1 Tax=Apolygus lucorum TaxID=248454 RepID=A0A6A4JTD1_APOLU|nr:hypothetical protein GE061_009745 [Apolygus lucorum]
MHPIILLALFSYIMMSISAFIYPPLILVPGMSDSQIEAKVAPPLSFNFLRYCDYIQWLTALLNPNTYFIIYWNAWLWLPFLNKCTVYFLRLNYNNVTRKAEDSPQIQTRVVGFGDPYWIEWYDYEWTTDWLPFFGIDSYYRTLAVALKSLGYTRNVSLRGAPYDFRKGLSESREYFNKLKILVEDTYKINGNKQVVLVTHSYGGTMVLSFLRAQTQKWKDKYIKSMISLAGVIGGSVMTIKEYILGDWLSYSSSKRIDNDIIKLSRSFPSTANLMPIQELWGNEVLVSRPQKNYSCSNIKELYEDLNDPNGYEMWKDQQPFVSLEPPGVEFHCFYSTTDKDMTAEKLVYDYEYYFPQKPRIEMGPGDTYVNLRSLDYCKKWKKQQRQAVYVKHFFNMTHVQILHNQGSVDYVTQVLRGYAKKIEI